MFSNLSRSCVLGWTSEHGMCRRIMLKSPCIKHLTRVRHTTPVRRRTTPMRRQTTPILADSSDRPTDHSHASRITPVRRQTTPILTDSSDKPTDHSRAQRSFQGRMRVTKLKTMLVKRQFRNFLLFLSPCT
ncbi:hypothetical protein Hanom_Chr08g00754341 [Helianthus anomalus]